MFVAYADPPYIGQAKRHYADDPQCAEVDHAALVSRLETYDAWALSCSSPSLPTILSMCPEGIRVCAWVKSFASFKPGVRLAYAWEPVIIKGWRKGTREDMTVRDWVCAPITMQRGVHGAKPLAFCLWLFEALGLTPADDLDDLYPGSGAVSLAWDVFRSQQQMFGQKGTAS